MKYNYKKSATGIINNQMNTHNYLFCQNCNRSGCGLEAHHIIFKSERPGHPEIHNPSNLILLCVECHNKFHGRIKGFKKHDMRSELIKNRNLTDLFN